LFLFEEFKDSFPISFAKYFSNLRNSEDGIYIIPTSPRDSEPMFSSWDEITNFIINLNSEIEMAGGYVHETQDHLHVGCLGHTKYKISQKGISTKFISNCCFTS